MRRHLVTGRGASLARRALLVLLLAVAAGAGGAALRPAGARAANQASLLGTPPTRWGIPDGFALTRLGGATFSSNLLHVGDTVTEHVTLNGDVNGWEWFVPSNFTVVAGCQGGSVADGTGDRSCTLMAVSPTPMQTPACGVASGNTVGYLYGGCYNNWQVTPTVGIFNGQGEGITDDYYAVLADQYAVEGDVVDPHGRPIAGAPPVTITLSPSQSSAVSTTTDTAGHYGKVILDQDPSVTVSAPAGYTAYQCPGTTNPDGSCTIDLDHDYVGTGGIDFQQSAFPLNGYVLGSNGNGVSGTSVAVSGTAYDGTAESTTATTNSSGYFSLELPSGTYTATAQPKGTEFPVASADCTVSNVSCQVTLTRSRNIKFESCVQPDPSGAALPANTPDPIPGAVTVGSLEAVGCFTQVGGGSLYTATAPIRLDGIDAVPASGTTITIDKNYGTVTSNGPVTLQVHGWAIATEPTLSLTYGSSSVSTSISAGPTGTLGFPNLFGIPFPFTSLLPFTVTPGSTSITMSDISGQISANAPGASLPLNMLAKWSPKLGTFVKATSNNDTVPRIGLDGTLTTTNRDGLTAPKVCGSITKLSPWQNSSNNEAGTIGPLSLCYDFNNSAGGGAGQWTGTGQITLPTEPGVTPVSVAVSLGLLNYQLNQGSVSVSGINRLLAYGVFLQGLNAGFSSDLVRGVASNITGGAALSFGPSVKGVETADVTGQTTIQLGSVPSVWRIDGNLVLGKGLPFATQVSHAFVQFTPGVQGVFNGFKLSFGGNATLQLPPQLARMFGFSVHAEITGFWDEQQQAMQFTGTGTLQLPLIGNTSVYVVSNNANIAVCDTNNGYSVSAVYNYFTGTATLGAGGGGVCNFTTLSASATNFKPSNTTRLAARSHGTLHAALTLPSGLNGETIQVTGAGAPPKVKVTGPGIAVDARGSGTVYGTRSLVYRDSAHDATYVVIYGPRAGRYHIDALAGSSLITAVRYSVPQTPPSISATVGGTSCERVVRYAYAPGNSGSTVALYAIDADSRQFLGDAEPGVGALVFTPTQAAVGSGAVEAVVNRSSLPVSTQVLATYPTAAAPARVPAPGSAAVNGSVLYWSDACGAARYRVLVRSGRKSVTRTTSDDSLTLPRGYGGRVTVAITSIGTDGQLGRTLTRTVGG